jgi:putative flippase GtrA
VILARLASSIYNYKVNKRFVFDAKSVPTKQAAPRYFALVAVIMLINYVILVVLSGAAGINLVVAKLITEAGLWIFSYTMQRLVVFKRHLSMT